MNMTGLPEMKRLNYLVGEIGAVYHAAAERFGLSDSVMQTLYTICESGGSCPLADVCRLTGLSKQTVHSAIRRLTEDGTIRMESLDSRSKKVQLTAAGARLAGETVFRLIRAENEILDTWRPEEVSAYLALTERFLTALREKTESL